MGKRTTDQLGQELRAAFACEVIGRCGSDTTFARFEAEALELSNELVRQICEAKLEELASSFGESVLFRGQPYRRHAEGTGSYHSLCGKLVVKRHSYRQCGLHNGPTIIPLEIASCIRENATPALAHSVLQGYAAMPLRAYEAEMAAAYRKVPARSTLERIAKRTGSELHDNAAALEAAVRESEEFPDAAYSITLGIDRTSAPMAETFGWVAKRESHHRRQPPVPVEVHYRMAYVGTIAINDAKGRVLTSLRFAATADEGPSDMLERMAIEVRYLLARRRLPVILIQDGAIELRRLMDDWERDFHIPVELKLIDRFHVDERLGQVAELLEPTNRTARWQLLARWRDSMKRSDRAIARLAETFRVLVRDIYDPDDDDFVPRPPMSYATIHGAAGKIIDGHVTYFDNQRDRFQYATARRRRYPIGSGVTEGACKSVIAARCKRSGQRWHETGLSPCLQLRSWHLNRRLRSVLDVHLDGRCQELRA